MSVQLFKIAPLTLPSEADLAEHVHNASLAVLAIAEDSDDPDDLADIQTKWAAYMRLVDTRRRKSSGKAEAVARLIELRIGEVMGSKPSPEWPPSIPKHEMQSIRIMHRFESVALERIERSTNQSPSTRNQVLKAIREHRLKLGEVLPYPSDVRRVEADRKRKIQALRNKIAAEEIANKRVRELEARRAEMTAETKRLAKIHGRRADSLYSLIRRALADADAILPDVNDYRATNCLLRAMDGLRKAESEVQDMLRFKYLEGE